MIIHYKRNVEFSFVDRFIPTRESQTSVSALKNLNLFL